MTRFVLALCCVAAVAASAHADGVTARWSNLSEQPYAGVPFGLTLIVDGFDAAPRPDQPKLSIPGATVEPIGVQGNPSRMIVNGRIVQDSVQWVMRWRVVVAKEGTVHVPSVTVEQGGKKATAAGGDVPVEPVATTDAMKLELALPDRPVFVGENIPVTVSWLFRAEPDGNPTFAVPMLDGTSFTIATPAVTDQQRVFKFSGGDNVLQLPFTVDQTDVGGVRYNRLRATFYAAPKRTGKIEIAPGTVVAALPIGRANVWGEHQTRMFRASDTPRTIDVKPLPETDRPAGFSGAVGTQFAMKVATSRSVVSLGEPVELDVTVKSDQRLDTLALPKLDGVGGLPKDKFAVPPDAPTGELSDEGKTKTFKVTAQVTGPTTEIPSLAFSYFDPVKGVYQTVHSEPIGLSVKGTSVVGASDVVAVAKAKGSAAEPAPDVALVGAELALSAPSETDRRPLGGTLLWLAIGLLYAVPLAVLGLQSYRLRTRAQREDAAEVREARRKVNDELARASRAPARETAGPLGAALRGLARALERPPAEDTPRHGKGRGLYFTVQVTVMCAIAIPSWLIRGYHSLGESFLINTGAAAAGVAAAALVRFMRRKLHDRGARARAARRAPGTLAGLDELLARLETESFAPSAASAPLPAALRTHVEELVARWTREARGHTVTPRTTVVALLVAAALVPARAEASTLDDGRAAYQQAMSLTDATAKRAAFARAEVVLGEAARATPDRPELLADWGNAALGAGDVATATLAYRRALALDPTNARARHNLSWVRSHLPDAVHPDAGTATDTLLFFLHWPIVMRLVVGAALFAIAIVLVMPWGGRRRRVLTGLAVLPLVAWVGLLVSVIVDRASSASSDAVVMDAVVLRAADSAGAPAAMVEPLARGTEVSVLERRDQWTKIRLGNGAAGWVQAGVIELVTP